MSSRKAKPSTASKSTKSAPGDALETELETTVAAYLSAHPDFFERNPRVLEQLEVSHGSKGAVSLIEHQVKVLRRELAAERGRLTHLIGRARDYESLSTRLHGLVLQLIPATDLEQLCDALDEALRREFSAEAVTLKLFPLDLGGQPDADPLTSAFEGFLSRDHALCGPLDADKSRILFGELGNAIQCAALIPIRAEDCGGVLAIGAADPKRFGPDMGTDLLDRLGEIVSHKLRTFASVRDCAPEGRSDRIPAAAPNLERRPTPEQAVATDSAQRPAIVAQPD